ncbi:MAG TPA: hypothetical protein VID29_01625 [Solirubrobacteraceae bacterium]|jgi:hypothetical protein
MTRHRTIFSRVQTADRVRCGPIRRRPTARRYAPLALSLLVAGALLPADATAGSLLSGYGGPGSGAQAILGSTLVGGAGSGGGSGSGGGGGGGGGVATTGGVGMSGAAGRGGATPAGGRGTNAASAGSAHNGSGGADRTSAHASPTYRPSTLPRIGAMAAAAEDPGPLGLSGTDLLLVGLAAGALIVTAGITRRMARTQH